MRGETVQERGIGWPGEIAMDALGPEVAREGTLAAARWTRDQPDIPGAFVEGQRHRPLQPRGFLDGEVENSTNLRDTRRFEDGRFHGDGGLHGGMPLSHFSPLPCTRGEGLGVRGDVQGLASERTVSPLTPA
jgi:hypothetical protein